jgi:hypothetical protein
LFWRDAKGRSEDSPADAINPGLRPST